MKYGLIFPAILGAAMSFSSRNAGGSELEKEVINIEYNNNYVIASTPSGLYERYEHMGFDNRPYCIQIMTLSEKRTYKIQNDSEIESTYDEINEEDKVLYIDGMDGKCDEKIDGYHSNANQFGDIDTCKDNKAPCKCWNVRFDMKKITEHIKEVKDVWNAKRNSCNKKQCFLSIAVTPIKIKSK